MTEGLMSLDDFITELDTYTRAVKEDDPLAYLLRDELIEAVSHLINRIDLDGAELKAFRILFARGDAPELGGTRAEST